MIAYRDVRKHDGSLRALDRLSLNVERGRSTVLIGPSGCGKSALLRLANGLIRPESGEVRFEHLPVVPETFRSIRPRMGYVIREGGLFPHLAARGNVTLMARHLGWSRERIDARVGAGGFGQPILTGIRLEDMGLILENAVPAALLAILARFLFDGLERLLVPRGLRLEPE